MTRFINYQKILPKLAFSEFELKILPQIDSTNEYVKQSDNLSRYLICLAEEQTAGQGRLNRMWYSPPYENIYCSIKCTLQTKPQNLASLNLAIAVAVHQSLQSILPEKELAIKWPNDILFEEKKLVGILAQMYPLPQGKTAVIIGIGLNVNMTKFNHAVAPFSTSIKAITRKDWDRNLIVIELLNQVISAAERFFMHGFMPFQAYYAQYDFLWGKTIHLEQAENQYRGIAIGLNSLGHLCLNLDGKVKAFSAGDARLKK